MHPAPSRGRRVGFWLVLGQAVCVLALAGCHTSPSGPPREHYRPPAYHPEDFPDIPLDRLTGYELDPNVADPLAISLAGGTVRRFELGMIRRPTAKDQDPAVVLGIFASELPAFGWLQDAPGRWHKGGEVLVIDAGRSRGLTTVRFHLRPADADASTRP